MSDIPFRTVNHIHPGHFRDNTIEKYLAILSSYEGEGMFVVSAVDARYSIYPNHFSDGIQETSGQLNGVHDLK